jgi:hypothetical protein
MPWLLGVVAVLITGAGAGAAMMSNGLEWVLGPLVTFSLGVGAIQSMKVANRRAQRRIAAGEFLQIPPEDADSAKSETPQS